MGTEKHKVRQGQTFLIIPVATGQCEIIHERPKNIWIRSITRRLIGTSMSAKEPFIQTKCLCLIKRVKGKSGLLLQDELFHRRGSQEITSRQSIITGQESRLSRNHWTVEGRELFGNQCSFHRLFNQPCFSACLLHDPLVLHMYSSWYLGLPHVFKLTLAG